ncbi:unnamed protein product [Allacma fusca]|uniref:Uncharacterized protein n=1 Tax=Allacma fusca TaxID=39272 RepID=A0A8J2Q3Q5_9HEXA|nr:unnamed protein product [Allacma fusca]
MIGEHLEAQIKHTQTQIFEISLKDPNENKFAHLKMTNLAKNVMQWRWQLTGGRIFVINYNLIPTFIGVLMAFMTFMIQFEMSGKMAAS